MGFNAADITTDRRVRMGVEWLDVTRHRWRSDVDGDQLDMMSFEWCIFGQLYGTYWHGQRKVQLALDLTAPQAMKWCIDHGFILASSRGNTVAYRNLTTKWRNEWEAA